MFKRLFFTLFLVLVFFTCYRTLQSNRIKDQKVMIKRAEAKVDSSAWVGKSLYQIPQKTEKNGALIQYGFELIAHTSYYLGPKGIVQQSTNGMNCQNCHLEAGTKPWGLNYGSVFSTYPKFRDRSGSIETIYKRVNDCMERSLNGKALDTNSKEMKSIYAYIKWLGNDVPTGNKVKGSGIEILPYLNTAANPMKGKIVYTQSCQKCHGQNGAGVMDSTGKMYLYPPLWGKHSYNDAAGLYQLSKLAGFIKNNMPNGINYHTSTLTNQESWDLAAFINSQPRPSKDKSKDWPILATKPVDYPFGPYADAFSEAQHKYGPFDPILDAKSKNLK
jgi:thiosulfate dehydrogenase